MAATTKKAPQDHLTAKVEAKKEDITVTFNEVEYKLPAGVMDNVEILEFIEDEKYINAVRAIVGVAQWSSFKEAHRDEDGKVTLAVFQEFIEAVFKALGTN